MDNNNIFQQAKNGSVTAVIQVLNDKLADSGIRTRAFLQDNGLLQLLCEAPTSDQLIEPDVIQLIKQILEDISPAKIRRVKISSRLVDEQQLLWLEEITRYPEKLLWSKEITLKKPNIIKVLIQNWQKNDAKAIAKTMIVYHSPSLPLAIREKQRRKFKKLILLSMSGVIIILLGAGIFFILRLRQAKTTTLPPTNAIIQKTSKTTIPQPPPNPTVKPLPNNSPKLDPFVQAVRLAEKTVTISKTAQTKTQWLEIAATWQKASDFMDQIPSTDKRYKLAQDRRDLYRKFSDNAQKEAKKRG